MIKMLISPVSQLVQTVLQGRIKKQAAKDERAVVKIHNEHSWDIVQAENSRDSWKDEFLTLVIALPLIMAFIPPLAPYVATGFAVIAETPLWYQGLVGTVFAAAFGQRQVSRILTKNSINRQQEEYQHVKNELRLKKGEKDV